MWLTGNTARLSAEISPTEHSFATTRPSNGQVLSLGISSLNLGRWATGGLLFCLASVENPPGGRLRAQD
jgi:hypothetical protein